MPFLGTMPAQQTVGSMFGQGFGQGMQQGISSSLEQFFKQKQMQQETSALDKALGSLPKDASVDDRMNALMKAPIGLETKKLYAPLLLQQAKQQEFNKFIESQRQAQPVPSAPSEAGPEATPTTGYSKQQLIDFSASPNKQIATWATNKLQNLKEERAGELQEQKFGLQKEKFEQEKKEKEAIGKIPEATRARLKNTFNRQLKLIEKGGLAIPYLEPLSKLSPNKRGQIAEFNTLGLSIEAALMPLVNKGTLAKPRFDYIMSNIPKADDAPETIKGKIKALSQELEVDIPEFKEEKAKEKEEKSQKIIQMRAPDGRMLNVPKDQVMEAQKMGAKLA